MYSTHTKCPHVVRALPDSFPIFIKDPQIQKRECCPDSIQLIYIFAFPSFITLSVDLVSGVVHIPLSIQNDLNNRSIKSKILEKGWIFIIIMQRLKFN